MSNHSLSRQNQMKKFMLKKLNKKLLNSISKSQEKYNINSNLHQLDKLITKLYLSNRLLQERQLAIARQEPCHNSLRKSQSLCQLVFQEWARPISLRKV